MEKVIFPTVITAVSIVCIVLAWIFSEWAKHKERVLLIQKGIDPQSDAPKRKDQSYLIKIGLILVGLSLGLLTISLSHAIFKVNISDLVGLSVMGIFGGASLILANRFGNTNGK